VLAHSYRYNARLMMKRKGRPGTDATHTTRFVNVTTGRERRFRLYGGTRLLPWPPCVTTKGRLGMDATHRRCHPISKRDDQV